MKNQEKPCNDIELEFINAFELYNDSLYRFAFFKLSKKDRALELVQEAYLKAWDYIRKGSHVDNMRAFLYKILNNLIIDEHRKKYKPYSLDELREDGFDIGNDEHIKNEDKLEGEFAIECLNDLSPILKEVLILKYVEDMSVGEIAKALNQNENTVSVRIHRAINELKNIYKYKTNG